MFVAKFLGTPPINIIPAKYNVEKKKVTFYDDFVRDTAIKNINFDELLANKVSNEENASNEENNLETENNDLDLFIGVRPEFIKIDEKGKYKVTVDMVEYIGRDKSMIFKFEGQENTCKAIIPSDVEIEPGQEVRVNFKRFFVFDKEGKRLL